MDTKVWTCADGHPPVPVFVGDPCTRCGARLHDSAVATATTNCPIHDRFMEDGICDQCATG
jgi:hypothetical protein